MKLLLDTHVFLWWLLNDPRLSPLPLHHRDPFDRLLIATALEEDMTLLTNDKDIHKYSLKVAW
jgi:PIN domain nuclease of toxin-antitoxin system